MELRTSKARWSMDGEGEWISLLCPESVRETVDAINFCGKQFDVEIKQHRERRSLNANSYAWALIGKIADSVRLSKEDVYLTMLKNYGQSDLISVLEKVPIEQYVKYYDEAGRSTLNGKDFVHYKVYKGTSEYNTLEMSVFIDGVVQEAKSLGIETLTPDELLKLKSLWNNE